MNPTRCLPTAALLLLASAAQAQQSNLIIRSDADCVLTVNGVAQGRVTAGAARPVPVAPGEQLVECIASSGAKAEEILEVFPGAQKVVQIKMARQLRFKADANRILDTKSGLTWLASDNGYDIDWNAAVRYCAGYAPGTWTLPSKENLLTLSGPNGAQGSPLFKLSSCCYWSSHSEYQHDVLIAWYAVFHSLSLDWAAASKSVSKRALCVRQPSTSD